MCNLLILLVIVVIVIIILKRSPPSSFKEGWYFNDFRNCLVAPKGYPGYWFKTVGDFGLNGETYPYAKPNKAIADLPPEDGSGCWASFTQYGREKNPEGCQ